MPSIDQILEAASRLKTPGIEYIPLVLIFLWLIRELINIRRTAEEKKNETIKEVIEITKQIWDLEATGASPDAVAQLQAKLLPPSKDKQSATTLWWSDFLCWQKMVAALLGAFSASLIKVVVICIVFYTTNNGEWITAGLPDSPGEIYGDWKVWVGALAISLICALVTVSLLRASNSTLTFYFFMSLLIAFIIPYVFLPFVPAIRAG
jgi:hypothetical protein